MSASKPGPATPRSLRLFLLAAVVFFAALAFGIGLLREGAGGGSASLIGGPFALVDSEGRPTTEKDLLGQPTLMFFGFTHCPDICPTTLTQVSEVFRELGPDAKVRALFVTVDPERDTPASMKNYLASFDPRIRGLSGGRPAIDAALKAYRVYAKKVPTSSGDYTMDHTALVYLMDKQGRFVEAFNLERKPAEAAEQLKKYL
jgi:protein SCO1/2